MQNNNKNINSSFQIPSSLDVNFEIDNLIFKALSHIENDDLIHAERLIYQIFNLIPYINKLSDLQWELIGSITLSLKKYTLSKAAYVRASNLTSAAYVSIIEGDLEDAEIILSNSIPSIAKNWCLFLTAIFLNKKHITYPSYSEIRHFLECTFYNLLTGRNENYKTLLKYLNKLSSINFEAEKIIGIAFYKFKDYYESQKYLKKSINYTDDVEAYYYLAKIFFDIGEYNESANFIKKGLNIFPDFYPCQELNKKLQSIA